MRALILLLLCQNLSATTIFEGYYRIMRKNLHSGFTVIRIDEAPVTKAVTITYFTRTFESDPPVDQAIAVLKQEASGKMIDAKFTGMDDETKTQWQKTFHPDKSGGEDQDVFFNTWLTRVTMANHPETGKTYSYRSLKESANKILQGEIKFVEDKSVNGQTIHRLLSDYDGFPVEWWVTDDGQVLYTLDVERGIFTYLCANADEAIDLQPFNRSELTKHFQEIPEGRLNPAARGLFKYQKGLFAKPVETKFKFQPDVAALKLIAVPVKK
jgi:hypothetical protein